MSRPEPAEAKIDVDVLARAEVIRTWLIETAITFAEPNDFITGFTQRLREAGLPLDRWTGAMPTLHSERRGIGMVWQRGQEVRSLTFGWNSEATYRRSPYFEAHETGEWVIFRPDETPVDRFDVVAELRDEGIAHYVCVPVFFMDGLSAGMTFATKEPQGFSAQDIMILRLIAPTFSLVMELRGTRIMLDDLLRIYVGEEPKKRILSGEVRRGEVVSIRSAILFADMRGFTALSTKLDEEATADLLNRFYDCVVPAIEAEGGEVLKYIGDGILAIFRVGDDGDNEACARALVAAETMLDNVRRQANTEGDGPRFDMKAALHFGEVAYGNVGSGARLDFTVIGHSVNLASRITDLCNTVSRRLLVSEAFAETALTRKFLPVGRYDLRGVQGKQQVFETR